MVPRFHRSRSVAVRIGGIPRRSLTTRHGSERQSGRAIGTSSGFAASMADGGVGAGLLYEKLWEPPSAVGSRRFHGTAWPLTYDVTRAPSSTRARRSSGSESEVRSCKSGKPSIAARMRP